MSFSRSQQGVFRPMVEAAWRVVCGRAEGAVFSDKKAKETWYRAALSEGLGVASSSALNGAEGFETAMLFFAEVAEDFSAVMFWQKKASEGNARRVLFVMRSAMPGLTAEYAEGTARRMFGRALADLDAGERRRLVAALKMHLARQAARGQETTHFHRAEEEAPAEDFSGAVEEPF